MLCYKLLIFIFKITPHFVTAIHSFFINIFVDELNVQDENHYYKTKKNYGGGLMKVATKLDLLYIYSIFFILIYIIVFFTFI